MHTENIHLPSCGPNEETGVWQATSRPQQRLDPDVDLASEIEIKIPAKSLQHVPDREKRLRSQHAQYSVRRTSIKAASTDILEVHLRVFHWLWRHVAQRRIVTDRGRV